LVASGTPEKLLKKLPVGSDASNDERLVYVVVAAVAIDVTPASRTAATRVRRSLRESR
jgi:hypothetical protein